MTTKDFERLYEAHFGMVYKYLMKLSGDSRLAEELTSDTSFKALAGIDSFRGLCSVSGWLCQIAKNSYFDYIKRDGKNVGSESLNAVEDRSADVEQNTPDKALAAEIFSKVHELKEPYKEVFCCELWESWISRPSQKFSERARIGRASPTTVQKTR